MICAYLQIRLRLDLLDECVRERLVELAADGVQTLECHSDVMLVIRH